jgi:hypothetical protein
MSDSEPFEKFRQSKKLTYEQWHDGVAYDLEAFAQMTPAERDQAAAEIRARLTLDWRDMEILRLHDSRESFDRLRDALAGGKIEERAYALRELIKAGRMSGSVPDFQLASVLEQVNGVLDGLTTALGVAEEHAGPMSNAALLRGARDRGEVAPHYAAMACYLAGVTDQTFDWSMRPLFLRLGMHKESPATHAAAFAELCRLINIDPAAIPERGCGRGIEFPNGRRPASRSAP